MDLEPPNKIELRRAALILSERGLAQSAKFCAELLKSCRQEADLGAHSKINIRPSPMDMPLEEDDDYVIGKAYFDCRDYRQCVHSIHVESTGASLQKHRPSHRAFFLRCYANYLLGEKLKEQEIQETENIASTNHCIVNKQIPETLSHLLIRQKDGMLDAFGYYLLGIILRKEQRVDEAREALIRSVYMFPLNWGAWEELNNIAIRQSVEVVPEKSAGSNQTTESSTANHLLRTVRPASIIDFIDKLGKLEQVPSPSFKYMKKFFEALHHSENSRFETAEIFYRDLEQLFPASMYVQTQIAMLKYNKRNFDEAEQTFERILSYEPNKLEGMDIYSNVLYVKENNAQLALLAQRCVQIDKYRPETCCVVGNYYSLRRQHELAVVYFERALKLNPSYTSAWTLMGHEYVEMKNTPAAINAYRRAVDINPMDYRAWYGLGQTYELLNMPLFTLYYFKKAAQLRPADGRMWCAMGHCYEELEQWQDAIRCYVRADECEDREGIAVSRLIHIYQAIGDYDNAAHYSRLDLVRREADDDLGPEVVTTLLFLARYEAGRGNAIQAKQYCEKLLDFPSGAEKDKAKELLRILREGGDIHRTAM